jgi:hypothetical protein
MMIVFELVLFVFGVFYVVFAYRAPPKAIDHLFRIDAVFLLFPEHKRVRLGRLTMGALICVGSVVAIVREVYQQIHWMLAR